MNKNNSVDALAMDCVITLKMHDMLNKLMEGEDIGDSDTARVIKAINKDVGKTTTDPFRSKILKHAVMLAYQLKVLSREHEILSHIKIEHNDEIGEELLRMGLRLSQFDYDDDKSVGKIEDEFVGWLATLAGRKQ